MLRIQGSIVAIVTPFNQDGSVNFSKLGELVDWQIQNGTDGIVALGTTGESATMTDEEDDAVCEYVLKRVNGRIPVIAGSGSNCTASMLEKKPALPGHGRPGPADHFPLLQQDQRGGHVPPLCHRGGRGEYPLHPL